MMDVAVNSGRFFSAGINGLKLLSLILSLLLYDHSVLIPLVPRYPLPNTAVISMGVIRVILRRDSVLENNMVQTIGSAGESVAAGAIFTMPAFSY